MILLLGAVVFLLVLALTPAFGRYLLGKGIRGVDVNKEKKPVLPENAGLGVVAASLAAYALYAHFSGNYFLFVNVYALLFVSLFGLLDYYRHFRPREKILAPLLIALVIAPGVSHVIRTPFGVFYSPILAMLLFVFAFTAFTNLTNMLAGFNGLESGLSAMAALSLSLISLLFGDSDAFALSFLFFAGLSAFWLHNRYPARVFPGDSLTLTCGAAFTLIAFQAGLELYLPIVLLPHVADAVLKFASAGVMSREDFKPVRVKAGRLHVERNTYLSLCRLFLLNGALTERELVGKVLALGALSSALAVLVAYGGMQ